MSTAQQDNNNSNENTNNNNTSTNKTNSKATEATNFVVSRTEEIKMIDKEYADSEHVQKMATAKQALENKRTTFAEPTTVSNNRSSARIRNQQTRQAIEQDIQSASNTTNKAIVDVDTLAQLLKQIKCCKRCQSRKVEVTGILSNGDIVCTCCNCQKRYQVATQEKAKLAGRQRKIPVNNYTAAVVAKAEHLNYKQYKSMRLVHGLPAYSAKTYNEIGSIDLYQAVMHVWEKMLVSVVAPLIRKAYKEINFINDINDVIPLIVKGDSSWTKRGHDSLDGHSTVKDAVTGLIIGFKCTHRDSPSGHRTGNIEKFFDQSSCMYTYQCLLIA